MLGHEPPGKPIACQLGGSSTIHARPTVSTYTNPTLRDLVMIDAKRSLSSLRQNAYFTAPVTR